MTIEEFADIYNKDPIMQTVDFVTAYYIYIKTKESFKLKLPDRKQIWYDPSYGNGGGDYIDDPSFKQYNTALDDVKKLNK